MLFKRKPDPAEAKRLVSQAEAAMDLSDWEEALALANRAIKADGNYAQAYCGRGTVYLNLDKPDRALPDLKRATEIDPGWATGFHCLTAAYRVLGNSSLAIQACEKAIELDPLPFYYRTRANLAAEVADYPTAIACLQRLISSPSSQLDGHYLLARTYDLMGDPQNAIEHMTAAIELDPVNVRLYRYRAEYFESVGDHVMAENDRAKADALGPNIDDVMSFFFK